MTVKERRLPPLRRRHRRELMRKYAIDQEAVMPAPFKASPNAVPYLHYYISLDNKLPSISDQWCAKSDTPESWGAWVPSIGPSNKH